MAFHRGATPAGYRESASRGGWRRYRAGLALAAALAVPLAVKLAASTPAARAALTERAAAALAAGLPQARLAGQARLDWTLRLVAGPLVLAGPEPAGTPAVTVEQVRVRPSARGLLRGRLEPGAVLLEGVRVEAGARGEALAELVRGLRARPRPAGGGTGSAGGAEPEVTFRDVRLRFAEGPGPGAFAAELGPLSGTLRLGRSAEGRLATLHVRLPAGGTADASFRSEGQPALRAELRAVRAEALPAEVRARLPFRIASGALDLRVEAARLAGAGEASVSAAISGLALRWDRLAPEVVGPVALRLSGTALWDRARGRWAFAGGRAELGPGSGAAAGVAAALVTAGEPRVELTVESAGLSWEALLAALPPQLRPPPEAPAVRGRLAGHLTLAGPLGDAGAWTLAGDLDPSGLAPAPPSRGALDLTRPFSWLAPLPGGGTRQVVVGPARARFVALGALPAHVVRAVLLSEDAGFFAHHGFDLREIQDALARADGGRRLRGASTITQQLAKNLFLSPERTLARKGREALTTLALEASLSKRRLLEIYLNVAEWGSGVHGIGEAAWHWFGKDARDLLPKEAAFLATVIPNPVRFELYLRRGALTENAEARVRDLLVKLRAAEVLSDAEFYEAWWAPLAFAPG